MEKAKKRSYIKPTLLVSTLILLVSGLTYYIVSNYRASTPEIVQDVWQENLYLGEIGYGNDNAPVEVIYFFSLTCASCIRFHHQAIPDIKSKLIDKGLVRLTMVGLPTDNTAATLEIIGRLGASEENYSMITDYAYSNIPDKGSRSKFIKSVTTWAKNSGMITQMMLDKLKGFGKEARDYLFKKRSNLVAEYNIEGVPALVIDGQYYQAEMDYASIASYVSKLIKQKALELKKKKVPTATLR